MRPTFRTGRHLLIPALLAVGSSLAHADDSPTPADLEFFEKQVRPLLVARCLECHGAEKAKGELRLDSRAAILEGGETGPAVEPGHPEASLLIEAIGYAEPLRMPPKSRLPDAEIATLTRWVERGAPWPVEVPTQASTPGEGIDLEAHARHWSFRPIQHPRPPGVANGDWPLNSIDRFLLADLEAAGLAPAPEADRPTLIRRLTFDLIGLPPTPAEVDAFEADGSPDAYERLVERLLGSPHHGERWGRHWLDLVCYAETLGHEFDYEIPDAYRYRDYVTRAFNADLPL